MDLTPRSLLDTNILVYADGADEPAKQLRAMQLITSQREAGQAVLSTHDGRSHRPAFDKQA